MPPGTDPVTRGRNSTLDGRRLELIRAAAKLFDRDGYHHVNITAIAAAVGLRKATLYHYFKSKEEILFWIHDEFVSELLARQAELTARGGSPRERLERSMVDILSVIRDRSGHVRVFFENFRELAPAQRKRISLKRDEYEQAIQAIIAEGMRAGDFRDGDPRLVALAFFGMVNWTYHWYRPDGPLSVEELAAEFIDLLMDGLARGTPARRS